MKPDNLLRQGAKSGDEIDRWGSEMCCVLCRTERAFVFF